MRFATLHVDNATPPLELRVTPLALAAGDPLANINRWASQIGLPSYDASQLGSVMHELEVHGRKVLMINLTGPEADTGTPSQQILAAIVPGDENAWFFMIMGDNDKVRSLEQGFEGFMKTVQITTSGKPAPASAPTPPPTSAVGPSERMTWQLPQHWTLQPGTSNMRVATFAVTMGNDNAEVTITRFAGDVGGLLPNINRWRRQLGMAPVQSLQDQTIENIQVAATPSHFLDLAADPNLETSTRMYVVTVPRRDMTWFIKMTGPAGFLKTQRASYDAFVASVNFAGGTPGE